MTERAIDRLVAKAKKARDRRRPKVWHFIMANWPKFHRLVRQQAVTYRALAEMLADEPEVQQDGKGPSEFAVRRAYVSVEALMNRGTKAKKPNATTSAAMEEARAMSGPSQEPVASGPKREFKQVKLRRGVTPRGES